MATNRLPVPAPMEMKGDLRANWKFFESQWENYEIATGLDKKEAKIRVATLLSVVGKDCFKTYQHLDLTDDQRKSAAEILRGLKTYFEPKTNVIYERYMFLSAEQQPNEILDSYVARLRALSDSCDYGTLQNDMIRDRLVLGTRDNGARARMLREAELTLEKAVDMCRTSEIAEQQMKKINVTETVHYAKKRDGNSKQIK